MKLRKVFRFRMRPTAGQEQSLAKMAGARRWVWNWALAKRNAHYKETGKTLPLAELSRQLTALKLKPETAWLKDCDSQALQQTITDLERAYLNFFEGRAEFPKFKSKKKDRARFRIPQRVSVSGGAVYVPKVGSVCIRQSQPIEGETKSATFKQETNGNWHVSLVTEFEMPDTALPDPETVVGVDLGLVDFAVLSTGERIPAPRFYRKSQRKLRRAQRIFARRKAYSKRRAKAKRRQATLQARAACRRGDFIHKLTTNLVRNYDAVCVEDLNVTGLARTKLAKSIHDAALGEVRRQLEYKTLWNRKHLVFVDRFYPSSQIHNGCGYRKDDLNLSDRVWLCACGSLVDRDLNAALNLRDEGIRILVAAGHAETIKHSWSGCKTSERRHSRAETRIAPALAAESVKRLTRRVLIKEAETFSHNQPIPVG